MTAGGPGESRLHPSATPEAWLYRKLIDWDSRLRREGQFLEQRLRPGPGRRFLDLGSATGDHSRFLAARGAEVVGVDLSPDMIASAREAAAADPRQRFVEGAIEDLPAAVGEGFHGAVCVGNTLVHLLEDEAIDSFLAGVGRRLVEGGVLVIQVLNYEAIVAERRRAFPVAVRPGDGDREIVWLRLLDHAAGEGATIEFESIVLERGGGREPTVLASRRSRFRAWRRADLEPRLERAVGAVEVLGSMTGDPFDPARSSDLVLVAVRSARG